MMVSIRREPLRKQQVASGSNRQTSMGALALALLLALPGLADSATLTVLQTTDIHGYVEHGDEGPGNGGWLRVATALRREREHVGADNCLLIDCGDTVAGSWTAAHSRGAIAVDMLVALDYDAWIPGNHELDYGVERLRDFYRRAERRVLCGNLVLSPGGAEELRAPAWRLFERAGCRVAVIGANSAFLGNWLWGDDRGDFAVTPALDMVARCLPEVHEHEPDVILLALHQGWVPPGSDSRSVNEVAEIADRFPEIDCILGGHTHREIPGIRIGWSTWYVQGGAHGNGYVRLRFDVDTERHRVRDVESEFVVVGEAAPDPECREAVAPRLQASRKAAAEVVGHAGKTLSAWGRPGIHSDTSELLCRAIAESANADVVLQGKHSQHDVEAGPITAADLFELVPYENGIGVAELTLDELRVVLAEQRSLRSSYVYCGVWGARVEWPETGGIGDVSIEAEGRLAPDGKRRYRVAFNSYTLAGGGGRFPELRRITRRPHANLAELPLDTRDALRRYLRSHAPVTLESIPWIDR